MKERGVKGINIYAYYDLNIQIFEKKVFILHVNIIISPNKLLTFKAVWGRTGFN